MQKPFQALELIELHRCGDRYKAVLLEARDRVTPENWSDSASEALRLLASKLEELEPEPDAPFSSSNIW